ncbi:hypothetical protein [Saccharothrix sp. ALI-22-I]|nr:hypothetical protein [Saccharothrix sp. ALI-22-I]
MLVSAAWRGRQPGVVTAMYLVVVSRATRAQWWRDAVTGGP